MEKRIREQLQLMAEEGYRKFSAALIPGVDNMLGIRLPELRKLARQIAKLDWKTAIEEEDIYFEERMLRGMVLNYVSSDIEEILPYIAEFIPLVNNWSVCDSVFSGMKILQKDRERTWEFIQPYLQSHREFEVRTALIIIMQHLLKCDADGKKISRLRIVDVESLSDLAEQKGLYMEKTLIAADLADTSEYYASMAAAWLIAETFCCFPTYTYQYLKKNNLDDHTYNKALQKIAESKIPTAEVKALLQAMKRK